MFSVAQTCSLPYRRFAIGGAQASSGAFELVGRLRNAIPRYSRLQVCATRKAETLNTYPRPVLRAAGFHPNQQTGCPRYTLKQALRCALLLVALVPVMSHAADWPMRGKDASRNGVSLERNAPVDWQMATKQEPSRNILWSARLGTYSLGDPGVRSLRRHKKIRPRSNVRQSLCPPLNPAVEERESALLGLTS